MSKATKRAELPPDENEAPAVEASYVPPGQDQDLGVLRPEATNPRKMGPERLAKLGYSMEVFGDLGGIVWNERTGTLVSGHQRVEDLRAEGATRWRRTDKTHGLITHPRTGEEWPVRIVDWELPKHQAAMLVANNPHLQGEFTADAVQVLHDVQAAHDLTTLELDKLLADLEPDSKDDDAEHPGLEDFDVRPRPRPGWILIGAPAEVIAEIESDLRGRYAGDEAVRIEAAIDFHKGS